MIKLTGWSYILRRCQPFATQEWATFRLQRCEPMTPQLIAYLQSIRSLEKEIHMIVHAAKIQ